MDLGGDANFFFTSQMTGCRFSVLTDDPKKPKVSHVAGTLSKTDRNTADKENFGDGIKSKNFRRLSVSQQLKHHYKGQITSTEGSSAFVYGVSDKEGSWSFAAQIVDLVIVQGFNPKKTANKPTVNSHKI
jgi:hypothetical protein